MGVQSCNEPKTSAGTAYAISSLLCSVGRPPHRAFCSCSYWVTAATAALRQVPRSSSAIFVESFAGDQHPPETLPALSMEVLFGSNNHGGDKAADLSSLIIAQAALEVQVPRLLGLLAMILHNEIFTSGGDQNLINRILSESKNETDPENKDDGESDDDNDDEGDDEDAENQEDDDGGDDGSDDNGNEEEDDDDDDDDPEANGEGGSDDDDDDGGEDEEEDDDDDDGDGDNDEDDEEEEEEDEDDDDVPQPPTKKRK